MAKLETVRVELQAEQVAALDEAVASGEYATPSEVVRVALSEWMERREFSPAEIAVLRQKWEEGVASGIAEPLEMTEMLERARRHVQMKGERQVRASQAGMDAPGFVGSGRNLHHDWRKQRRRR